MKTKLKLLAIAHLLSAISFYAHAQGTAFTYQGRLNDGVNPANGVYDLTFSLFTTGVGPGQVGSTLTSTATSVSNGLFTVTLDFGNQFPGADRWLEIAVRTNATGSFATLSPRQQLTATPYATTAGNMTGTITEAQLPANTARLNIANTTSQATGVPVINSGFITAANITFGGSGYLVPPVVTADAPLGSGAVITAGISGGSVVVLTVVDAGSGYTSGATITIAPPPSNGFQIFTSTNYFTTANFLTNVNNSIAGTFSGNGAALSNLPAWRLGGNAGTASGAQFIGTTDNQPLEIKVNGVRAVQLMAVLNDAAYSNIVNIVNGSPVNFAAPGVVGATICGGGAANFSGTAYTNQVFGVFGTVGGGTGNTGAGAYSTVSGGNYNSAGGYATVGGGFGNSANGGLSTIGGGQSNTNIGTYATVPGGFLNAAAGDYSFAAGRRAKANHTGAFVWADSINADFASTTSNQFIVRASGGAGLASNSAFEFGFGIAGKEPAAGKIGYAVFTPNTLDIVGGGTTSANRSIKFWCEGGATFTGVINAPSDRNLKEDFQSLDAREVLAKVAALPIQSWTYKYDDTKRHIGPAAQDFHAAFGLNGDNDKTIATVDADGVALAAIQGLNEKVEVRSQKSEDRIQKLEAENAHLNQELSEIKQLLTKLSVNKN